MSVIIKLIKIDLKVDIKLSKADPEAFNLLTHD